jgi:hypothetical protein
MEDATQEREKKNSHVGSMRESLGQSYRRASP